MPTRRQTTHPPTTTPRSQSTTMVSRRKNEGTPSYSWADKATWWLNRQTRHIWRGLSWTQGNLPTIFDRQSTTKLIKMAARSRIFSKPRLGSVQPPISTKSLSDPHCKSFKSPPKPPSLLEFQTGRPDKRQWLTTVRHGQAALRAVLRKRLGPKRSWASMHRPMVNTN